MTDACENVTRYEYNDLGHKTAVILPDGSKQTTTYDLRGNITSQTDANGNTTTYQYNGAGNVTKEIRADGERKTFAYNTDREVTNVTDYGGTKSINTYKNHLLTQSKVGTDVVKYTYDDYQRLTSTYDSTGTIYGFDKYNRLTRQET